MFSRIQRPNQLIGSKNVFSPWFWVPSRYPLVTSTFCQCLPKWQKYVGYNGRTCSDGLGVPLIKLHGIVWPQSLGVISVISYNVQTYGGIFSPSADVQAAKDRSTNASLPKFLWVAWQKTRSFPHNNGLPGSGKQTIRRYHETFDRWRIHHTDL